MPTDAVGRFAPRFLNAYLDSLNDYRQFYDDIAEIGNPNVGEYGMYFVPGISGTPGQMRLALPSLTRVFGAQIAIKALFIPSFSARQPIWDKYTVENTDEKLARLRADLVALLERFDRIIVTCSSNGVYDFLAVASTFPPGELESRVELAWVACAPDKYQPTKWQKFFYPLNGVETHGYEWFAYPNHNALKRFNPEVVSSFPWREGHQQRWMEKADIESRFVCYGVKWAYVSTTQLGAIAQHVSSLITRPWNAPAEVLIAENDGYWQGIPHDTILATVHKYAPQAHCVFRPGSHLSVVNPTTLTELFTNVRTRLQPHGAHDANASAPPDRLMYNRESQASRSANPPR
jgi:hypothetical protein